MEGMGSFLIRLSIVAALAWTGPVFGQTQLNRCTGADGVPIYTDRACSHFDAEDHVEEPDVPEAVMAIDLPPPRPDCPRRIETLENEVRAALDAGDVNSLAGLYHWSGASEFAAHTIMASLAILVERSLVDIGVDTVEQGDDIQPTELWLDLEDLREPTGTVHTRFRIRKNAGCWWIHG